MESTLPCTCIAARLTSGCWNTKKAGRLSPPGSRNFPNLERPAQRELNQTRVAVRLYDLSKRAVGRGNRLHVGNRGVSEVGVVPQIEEVRREADIVPFANFEVFQERDIPILLERTTVDVAAEIPESGTTEVRIVSAIGWIDQWSWRERRRYQVSRG